MDQQQIRLLQRTFSKIEPIAQETGELFYRRLFDIEPDMRTLFKGDMKKQAEMLMTAIGLTVESLDHPERVTPQLERIGQRHIGYGAMPNDFDKFGAALLWAFGQSLGDAWTPEVQAAWVEAFEFIRQNMKQITT
jgi:hemoglobin-like flavoprotein